MTTAETVLSAGEFYTGSLRSSNDRDFIGVEIEEGRQYTIEISTYYRAGFSATLLENPGSGFIEWSDTHGLDSTAYFTFVATETTTVYVSLSGNLGRVGRYDISVYPMTGNFSTLGDDDLVGSDGRNRIDLQKGDDIYYAFGENDSVFGGAGNDSVFAGEGNDFVRGEDGDDQLNGDEGNDILYGGEGHDTIDGGIGNDRLDGARGRDELRASDGDDFLDGGAGADVIDGGAGIDTATFAGANSGISLSLNSGLGTRGNANGDTYFDVENVTATEFDDFIIGSSDDNHLIGGRGRDELRGGAGDDRLEGGGGRDIIKGGAGIDTASFVTAASGVALNLTAGIGKGGNATGDVYVSIENVIGSLFDDTLIGSSGANLLNGGRGQDVLRGSAGDDTLIGARDDDTLVGGSGSDVFLFRADNGHDVITDFSRARDMIAFRIDDLEFSDLNMKNVDGNAVIDYGTGSIFLEGVSATLITADHFDFG